MSDPGAPPSQTPSANAALLLLLASAIASCGDRTGLSTSGDAAAEAATSDARADDAPVDAPTDAGRPDAPLRAPRPFLVGSSPRCAPPSSGRSWSAVIAARSSHLPPDTARRFASLWLADALAEHASIAAFARFTLQLLSVAAPFDLVADAQRASLDELRHARLCFGLARRYGASLDAPGSLPLHDVRIDATLAEVAALTAEEGCVGETLGAALAFARLGVSEDPEVAQVLARIASDERRHAALAWRFVAWAVKTGGDPVRQAVAMSLDRAVVAAGAMKDAPTTGPVSEWHAHGHLTCAETRSVVESALRDVIGPASALVLARGGGAASVTGGRSDARS